MSSTSPRRRVGHPVAALVTLFILCATSAATAITLAPGAAAAAPADAPAVSLIGDSTMLAMSSYRYDNSDPDALANNDIREIVGNSYALTFDAASCRRLVNPSCRGRGGFVPLSVLPLMRSTLQGRLGEAMVVMAGYDDASISSAVDAVMAEAESQGVTRVLWLDYPTGTNYVLPGGLPARTLYESHNAALADAAGRHPALRVLPWNTYSDNRVGWFTADGIHLTGDGAAALANYITTSLNAETAIGRCRASSALTGTLDPGTGPVAGVSTSSSGFVPIEPTRVLDTRTGTTGGGQGKLGAGRTVEIDLDAVLPDDADAAVLTLTAVDACLDGFLTVFACGGRPPTSSVNFEVGRTTAGMVISGLTDRSVCIYSLTTTDVVVDVTGAFSPTGDSFHPITPMRWIDTRGGPSQLPEVSGTTQPATEVDVQVAGVAGVPEAATAAWINLTVADPAAASVLLAYPGPCGSAPLASSVNARAQRPTASAVLVGLGDDGSICVRTVAGVTDVVVDVAGWFGPGDGGLRYQPRQPERLLDSRTLSSNPTAVAKSVPIDSVSVLNVAAVDGVALGFVSARPCGADSVSSLVNAAAGEAIANVTAVGPGANGAVCVGSNVAIHVVVDRVGSFVPD